MSEHTKAPWHIMGKNDETGKPTQYWIVGDSSRIAVLNTVNAMGEDLPIPQDANARLIAAAPDLLEALQDAANEIAFLQSEAGEDCRLVGCYGRIRELINKAEGD